MDDPGPSQSYDRMVLDEELDPTMADPMDVSVTSEELLKVPYEERWELLKPALEPLFFDGEHTLEELAREVFQKYKFQANEKQYKYRFKKWNWKKNVPKGKKARVYKTLQTRKQQGKSSGKIVFKGHEVEKRKLVRYLNSETKQMADAWAQRGFSWPRGQQGLGSSVFSEQSSFLENSIFLNWHMPNRLLQLARNARSSSSMLSPSSNPSPGDITALTPSSHEAGSPNNAPSPLTIALSKKQLLERSQLFVAGEHKELAQKLNSEERETLSLWMYDYWYYLYKTAKHWGYGPRDWTADILQTPRLEVMMRSPSGDGTTRVHTPVPPILCRWSVHVPETAIIYNDDGHPNNVTAIDGLEQTNDHSTPWSSAEPSTHFTEKVTQGLESNNFSTISPQSVPMAISPVIEAARLSSSQMKIESLCLAIMSGNYELFDDILGEDRPLARQLWSLEGDFENLYPIHMAIAYLNGARSCCLVLSAVLIRVKPRKKYMRDGFGHSVLDSLFMKILRSHTSMELKNINSAFTNSDGADMDAVDICGRWDHESICYQALKASGKLSVPMTWKHKFCHTSVQVICHCLRILFSQDNWYDERTNMHDSLSRLAVNGLSGLLVKYCDSCGLKMELRPLHVLVAVAFHLAQSGAAEEDLFGIIVVLMQLLAIGADALCISNIDAAAIFGSEPLGESSKCFHRSLTPFQLATAIPSRIYEAWDRHKRISWQVIQKILQLSESWAEERILIEKAHCGSDDEYSESTNDGLKNYTHFHSYNYAEIILGYSEHGPLPLLFTLLQTEVLTYRRQQEKDSWLSGRINLDSVLQQLSLGQISLGRFDECDLRETCSCGDFDTTGYRVPGAEHATVSYISNLGDNWKMLHAIPYPFCDEFE